MKKIGFERTCHVWLTNGKRCNKKPAEKHPAWGEYICKVHWDQPKLEFLPVGIWFRAHD